jgi:hypothetical protein
MLLNQVSVVFVHGAWADGSSWAKVITPLAAEGFKVVAAPLPLTSFQVCAGGSDGTAPKRANGQIQQMVFTKVGGPVRLTTEKLPQRFSEAVDLFPGIVKVR